jgi:uncharacterized Zn finger protein
MSPRFDQDQLRAYVGDRVFARGQTYFENGAVSQWDAVPGGWRGTVMGTSHYEVELKAKTKQPEGLCDCPAAEDGSFCKHLVALALTVMAADGEGKQAIAPASRATPMAAKKRNASSPAPAMDTAIQPTPKSAAGKAKASKQTAAKTPPESDEAMVRRWLIGLPPAAVVDRAIHYAGEDRDRWRSLVAEAHAALAPPEARQGTIKRLIGSPRFMDYRRTMRYAQSLEPMFGIFADTTRQSPPQALDLVLYALQRLLTVYANSDDSSGVLGDVISRVGKSATKAAQAHTQANPAILKSLFAVLERDDWSIVGLLRDWSPALDDRGLAELQQMTQRRLDAMPAPVKPGATHDYERMHVQRLLEQIMQARGDIEGILGLRAAHLRSGYDYLQLAELYESHKRHRQAIDWLERGLKAFPDETRLHQALAAHYDREGFAEDALAVRRQAFERQPTEAHFLALRKSVRKKTDWPSLRETLYAALEKRKDTSSSLAVDMKVRFMLLDGEIDRAHTLALKGGVYVDTWRKLFAAMEQPSPAAAAQIAKRLIDRTFENAYYSNYDEPVAWLQKMKALATRNRDAANLYQQTVDTLRTQHGRKTKLMKMLDAL